MPCNRSLPVTCLCTPPLPQTQEISQSLSSTISTFLFSNQHSSTHPKVCIIIKTEENTLLTCTPLIAWKWRGRGKHWVSSTLLFTLMLVWVMRTLPKGQHFFGRQMRNGTSSLKKKKTRQCHISATSENSLLPWPSGSRRSISSRTFDWSFKNKTQSQSPLSQEEFTQKTW